MEKKNKLAALCLAVATVAMAALLVLYGNSRTANSYTGSANGMEGPVVVRVVTDGKTLSDISVVEHNETPGIGTIAAEQLPGRILAAQSLQVDAIAGCTVTSNAIKEAVRAALASAGIDATPFEKEVDASAMVERTPETIDVDVVVVGAGGAGLTAATTAAQQGKTVLVVEKMPMVGGNSLKATGGMNAAGTDYQAAAEIYDSGVDEFIEDTMNGGHGINNRELVTVMSQQSASAIDWLTAIGAPLPKLAATGGTKHKYLHEPEDGSAVGPYLVEKLSAAAEKAGVTVMLNTEATGLLMADGKAAGILAVDSTHEYTINAKAVVLATGGFGSNFELLASFNPDLAHAVTTNHAGATGDGILMAMEAGAATVDMEQIQLHPTVYQENGMLITESLRSAGAILVNAEGKRFTNDMSTRDAVSAAELQQTDAYAYIIFDGRIAEHQKSVAKYINSGLTVTGDTYEALAAAIGYTGDTVQAFVDTMNTWNAAVAAGEDTEFGRNNGMDEDLSQPPFYAIKIAPGVHHTMGGVAINTNTEVLKADGTAIPGLFAAGEVTGGVHGGNRIGGNAVCDFVVFGRIAGAAAADFAG